MRKSCGSLASLLTSPNAQPNRIMKSARTRTFLGFALTAGGLITCLIGLGHAFMPTLGYDPKIPQSMAPAVRAHFYFLGTYAICAFLWSLGLLSLYFGGTSQDGAARVVCSILAALWIVRTILEILYPVDLRPFFLHSPHVVLLPVIAFLALLYSGGAVAAWRIR